MSKNASKMLMITMRFKLAFSHNSEGMFVVTAAYKLDPSIRKSDGSFVALYKNSEEFIRIIAAAGLSLDDVARISGTAMIADFNSRIEACCEDIDLTADQLTIFFPDSTHLPPSTRLMPPIVS
jgi:hypothetical protein